VGCVLLTLVVPEEKLSSRSKFTSKKLRGLGGEWEEEGRRGS